MGLVKKVIIIIIIQMVQVAKTLISSFIMTSIKTLHLEFRTEKCKTALLL